MGYAQGRETRVPPRPKGWEVAQAAAGKPAKEEAPDDDGTGPNERKLREAERDEWRQRQDARVCMVLSGILALGAVMLVLGVVSGLYGDAADGFALGAVVLAVPLTTTAYARHRHAEVFANLAAEARPLAERERIARLEAELNLPLLRDGACPKCGATLVVGAPHCPACGVHAADYVAEQEQARVARELCAVCGARTPADAKFCPSCGHRHHSGGDKGDKAEFRPQPTSATRGKPDGREDVSPDAVFGPKQPASAAWTPPRNNSTLSLSDLANALNGIARSASTLSQREDTSSHNAARCAICLMDATHGVHTAHTCTAHGAPPVSPRLGAHGILYCPRCSAEVSYFLVGRPDGCARCGQPFGWSVTAIEAYEKLQRGLYR